MFRLVAGVVLGYALFAFAALLIFQMAGRDPHSAADPAVMVGTIGAGVIAALTGGYLGANIANGRERAAGAAIAIVIGGIALFSLIAQPSADTQWSQLGALVLMSPAAFLGSLIRARRPPVR